MDIPSTVTAVASALSLETSIGLDGLVDALRDKRLLVVLDNCEHVLFAASSVAETLARACPQLRILATSRTSLAGTAPDTFAVPPLTLPASNGAREFDGADAVRLFVERAIEHDPSFELTAETRPSVAAVVLATGGLPLALELAAAQLADLSVAELAATASQPRRMAAWSDRSRPDRQQTLESSLTWSAELSTSEERTMWARLAVFDGPFDIDAVEAVCTDDALTCDDALDLVQSLVEQSLLARLDDGRLVRYALSPAARRFGRRALSPTESRELRRRLSEWRAGAGAKTHEQGSTVLTTAQSAGTSRTEKHPDSLTAREDQVATLVAAGLTNRQIAARLMIATRTVDGYVQHVLTKLGYRSRSQIAAWVAQRARSTALVS